LPRGVSYHRLFLTIHPNKISIKSWRQGVDVLGYISFPNHRQIRTKTKNRIKKNINKSKKLLINQKISQERFDQTIASYKGRVKYCWSQKLNKYLDID
jgi:hypothetical protein